MLVVRLAVARGDVEDSGSGEHGRHGIPGVGAVLGSAGVGDGPSAEDESRSAFSSG